MKLTLNAELKNNLFNEEEEEETRNRRWELDTSSDKALVTKDKLNRHGSSRTTCSMKKISLQSQGQL